MYSQSVGNAKLGALLQCNATSIRAQEDSLHAPVWHAVLKKRGLELFLEAA